MEPHSTHPPPLRQWTPPPALQPRIVLNTRLLEGGDSPTPYAKQSTRQTRVLKNSKILNSDFVTRKLGIILFYLITPQMNNVNRAYKNRQKYIELTTGQQYIYETG